MAEEIYFAHVVASNGMRIDITRGPVGDYIVSAEIDGARKIVHIDRFELDLEGQAMMRVIEAIDSVANPETPGLNLLKSVYMLGLNSRANIVGTH